MHLVKPTMIQSHFISKFICTMSAYMSGQDSIGRYSYVNYEIMFVFSDGMFLLLFHASSNACYHILLFYVFMCMWWCADKLFFFCTNDIVTLSFTLRKRKESRTFCFFSLEEKKRKITEVNNMRLLGVFIFYFLFLPKGQSLSTFFNNSIHLTVIKSIFINTTQWHKWQQQYPLSNMKQRFLH